MGIAKIIRIIDKKNNREEYFENPTQDYFNINKNQIQLIKGNKKGAYIRLVPDHYGPKGTLGYALIRGYNCQARCTYCYLQSYLKSPDLVKFQNIDDYIKFLNKFLIKATKNNPKQQIFLYDGDFYDSLGYSLLKDNISDINKLIDLIEQFENVFLEIRTKGILNDLKLYDNLKISGKVVYGITFSPQTIIEKYEIATSNFTKRLEFGNYIAQKGGQIGIRIDPIIFDQETIEITLNEYIQMIENIQKKYGINIFNRAIGTLRIKENLYKQLLKINNSMTKNLIKEGNFYTYGESIRKEIYEKIKAKIKHKNIYVCMDNI